MFNPKFGHLGFFVLFSKAKFEKHFAGLKEYDHIYKVLRIFRTFQNFPQPEKITYLITSDAETLPKADLCQMLTLIPIPKC